MDESCYGIKVLVNSTNVVVNKIKLINKKNKKNMASGIWLRTTQIARKETAAATWATLSD